MLGRTSTAPPPPPPPTTGAAVSVMSSGKPHQSQDPQAWSCGLVARPVCRNRQDWWWTHSQPTPSHPPYPPTFQDLSAHTNGGRWGRTNVGASGAGSIFWPLRTGAVNFFTQYVYTANSYI